MTAPYGLNPVEIARLRMQGLIKDIPLSPPSLFKKPNHPVKDPKYAHVLSLIERDIQIIQQRCRAQKQRLKKSIAPINEIEHEGFGIQAKIEAYNDCLKIVRDRLRPRDTH